MYIFVHITLILRVYFACISLSSHCHHTVITLSSLCYHSVYNKRRLSLGYAFIQSKGISLKAKALLYIFYFPDFIAFTLTTSAKCIFVMIEMICVRVIFMTQYKHVKACKGLQRFYNTLLNHGATSIVIDVILSAVKR